MFCALCAHKFKTSSFAFALQSSSMGFFLLCLDPVRLQEFVSAQVSVDFLLNEDGTLKEFDCEIDDHENLEEIEFIPEADEHILKHLVCFKVTLDSNTMPNKLDTGFISFSFSFFCDSNCDVVDFDYALEDWENLGSLSITNIDWVPFCGNKRPHEQGAGSNKKQRFH